MSTPTSRRAVELSLVKDSGQPKGVTEYPSRADVSWEHPENPRVRAMHAFGGFLSTRPTLDETARFLVALLGWSTEALGCMIAMRHGAGYEVIGLNVDQLRQWSSVAETRQLPRAVQEFLASVPDDGPAFWTPGTNEDGPPFGVWPLGVPADPHAYLALGFRTHEDVDDVAAIVRPLAGILSIYLAGMEAGEHATFVSVHQHGASAFGEPTLHERQLRILELMAEGLTNTQIAARIGFSESTVRMESLAIYRFFDVHDRHDAVIVARNSGYLPASSD